VTDEELDTASESNTQVEETIISPANGLAVAVNVDSNASDI